MTQPAHRIEGRLFAEDGQLCMVIGVDASKSTAQISSQRRLFELPVADVCARLSAYTHLSLDGLNSERTARRLTQTDEGWFFRTREQELMGPYENEDEANEAMSAYIITKQEGRVPDQR